MCMYVLLSPCALFPDDELGSPSTSTVGKTEEKDSSDVDQSFVSDERSEAAEVPSEREEARSEEPSEAATTAAATATATATDEQHPEPAKASCQSIHGGGGCRLQRRRRLIRGCITLITVL